MKKILGLDIGTNSIGWSVIEIDEFGKSGRIIALGSRIIPMDGDAMQKFESGTTVSKNADRRQHRMSRRLKQRFVLRRTRLLTVLKILGWVPETFPTDFKNSGINDPDFKFNINNYLPFDDSSIKEAHIAFGTSRIPDDWVIYYLRHKAPKEKISLSELARIIYMLNQRRGFKSSRKDKPTQEDIEEIKYPIYEKWVQILRVMDITELAEEKGIKTLQITAGDIIGQIKRKNPPDWLGKEIELEVTKKTIKSGEISYSLSLPNPSEWEKQKTALNKNIRESINLGESSSAGDYFYLHLKKDKNYRIRQRIVDRDLYQKEFGIIWNKQAEFYPELTCKTGLSQITECLYRHNDAKKKEITNNSLFHLIANDILYYQRPLKSQKHSIDFCSYEKKYDPKGNVFGVRVAPKSSPEFQEFRIWQTIHNLRILQLEGELNGKQQIDLDVSEQFLTAGKKAQLFKLFDSKKEISHLAILKELGLTLKTHRLNYASDRSFLGNVTKEVFRKVFKKHKWAEGESLLADEEVFYQLWHILYSLNDSTEIKSALKSLQYVSTIPENIIDHLSNLPDLSKQYASYSSKALKKFLSLMRCGSYFSPSLISLVLKNRIENIITGEYDENISDELRNRVEKEKKKFNLSGLMDFQGLPVWLAAYIIYGKHSEKENKEKYDNPEQIDVLRLIPNNSLRNPVVEQVSKETLSLARKIWQHYGQPDEIHIELARDLKKTAEERKQLSDIQFANENERRRIRSILRELKNANPESLRDIEKLRYWEETGNEEARNTSIKFSKEPTKSEIDRYKLWGEQNHISPYTGKLISLSELFTPKYEIEHIIPRSRFFDDSFGNKTICETAVNDFKSHRTAREMIETDGGRTITHKGHTFNLLKPNDYIDHCKRTFRGKKLHTLLREEIPKDFIDRQINDTRYITRMLAELLHPIAKDDAGVIFTIGQISSELKDKWGLNRVWKEILKPRFERLAGITGEQLIEFDQKHNDIHFKKDYKRVDHRHHALDALVIACTTREHVRYLNTLNSVAEKSKYQYLVKKKYSDFILPWETFTKEAREKLNEIIISHKCNNRVISKGVNKYTKWVQKADGTWKKEMQQQITGKLTSIRRSMFKEPLGRIQLREYRIVTIRQALEIQYAVLKVSDKVSISQIADKKIRQQINKILENSSFDLAEAEKFLRKNTLVDDLGKPLVKISITEFKEYAAKRVSLDNSFTHDKIDKIPYAKSSWLAQLLHHHLDSYNNKPEEAFRGEGLESLMKKADRVIKKVTIFEDIGKKISFKGKLVEADKGSNLFFIIYEDIKTRERIITEDSSIPLLDAIERLTNQFPIADDRPGCKSIVLSPNDLVYVPEEGENIKMIDWQKDIGKIHSRIYKVVSFTKYQCFFIPHFISRPLDDKGNELGLNNKSERDWNGEMIKNVCIKIKVDSLGNIVEADSRKLEP
jgi:CRISPR-associated endonuclease Csn1